jgi:putative peptide zinc metalloprotease protein
MTAGEVAAAHERIRAQIEAIGIRPRRPTAPGLWFRVPCLPAPVIDRVSRWLAVLLHPVLAWPLALAAGYAAFRSLSDGNAAHRAMMATGTSLLPILGLFAISMLFHELGHAAACARYGVRTREVGFGLYLVFPAAYSDVSAAWTLTRRQRVVVDVSGVLFQLAVGLAYVAAHRLTGAETWRLAAILVFGVSLAALAPIFKLDGYWMMADLLGVPNLYQQLPRIARQVRAHLARRPVPPLPWPPWVTIVVSVYGVLSVLFLTLFAARLGLIFADAVSSYPALVSGLLRDLAAPPYELATGRLNTILGPTYVLLGVSLAVVSIARWAFRATR